uniref:Interleukin 6 signal transducer n=1 Tax=Cyprinus carpio TaxID=7962 RepID=A0A8C2ERE4_CYPCA
MDTSHHFLLLMLLHYAIGSNESCVKILPDSNSSIALEVGKNFTATCHLLEGSGYTSDDIEWNLKDLSIEKQFYRKINQTAVGVTVNASSDMSGWLRCSAAKKCMYGITLYPGYPPLKPKNLSCIAVQEDKKISPNLNCSWDPGSRDPLLDTTYTHLYDFLYKADCNQRLARYCVVNLDYFPNHVLLTVWVEVKNALGSERSDTLEEYSKDFAKPNPPSNIQVLTEVNISTSLMVTWKHLIKKNVLTLSYAIRYRKAASDVWVEVWESQNGCLQFHCETNLFGSNVGDQMSFPPSQGDLEKLKRYNISVYPIYKYKTHFQAGRPVTRPAYVQQGTPERGPTVKVDKFKKNSAELTWEEIPLDIQHGFITNYTIFYAIGNTKQWESPVTVGPNVHSYVLMGLASETDYVVNVMVSTVAGSVKGMDCTFKTMKYGDGEVEVIVVVVCLSFLFLTVFVMLCLRKREVIKKLLWPQVPDPSDSSIAHWSPDFPIKVRELQSIKIMDESHKNMSIKIPFHYEVVVAVIALTLQTPNSAQIFRLI